MLLDEIFSVDEVIGRLLVVVLAAAVSPGRSAQDPVSTRLIYPVVIVIPLLLSQYIMYWFSTVFVTVTQDLAFGFVL